LVDTAVMHAADTAIAPLHGPTAMADNAASPELHAAMPGLPAHMDTAVHLAATQALHAAMRQLPAVTPQPHAVTTAEAQEWFPAAACGAAVVVACTVVAAAEWAASNW